jgi:hypothetical protein
VSILKQPLIAAASAILLFNTCNRVKHTIVEFSLNIVDGNTYRPLPNMQVVVGEWFDSIASGVTDSNGNVVIIFGASSDQKYWYNVRPNDTYFGAPKIQEPNHIFTASEYEIWTSTKNNKYAASEYLYPKVIFKLKFVNTAPIDTMKGLYIWDGYSPQETFSYTFMSINWYADTTFYLTTANELGHGTIGFTLIKDTSKITKIIDFKKIVGDTPNYIFNY